MKTKEQIWELKDELKKIWLKHKDSMSLRNIFDNEMTEFFDTAGTTNFKCVEWMTLVSLSAKWTREENARLKEEDEKELETLSPEQIQDGNRTKMIHILRKTLNIYERNPKQLKSISLSDVKGLYKIIQSLEEIKKKTDIERNKLKLDVIKTLLPYNRMTPEKIEELQRNLASSFDRIDKFHKGELVAPKIEEPNESDLE